MRKCLVLAALIAAPALAVVACQSNTRDIREKVTGEVIEKTHKPKVVREEEQVQNREQYTLDQKEGKLDGEIVTITQTPQSVIRPECFELTVRRDDNDQVIKVCDKPAYKVLKVGDSYDSLHDYGKDIR